MSIVNVKLRQREKNKYRKIVSTDETIYESVSTIVNSSVPYVAGATLEEGEWQEKKEALNQAASLLENQQKEEAVLAKDIASLQQKLTQKKELLARQKEALHRRGLIRQLEQLFKGNAFIEYVSESRLRSIAAR